MATLATEIYEILAQDIITGDLAPGQKMDELQLARRFNVSRTPVREALRQLAARGLVDFTPRQGGVVARIGLDKLTDMLDAECEIEGLCARLASQKMTALERQELRELFEQGNVHARDLNRADFNLMNQAFHELIGRGTHNETLHRTMCELRNRLAPFRQVQPLADEARLLKAQAEHEQVLKAILKNDADEAYAAMRDHNARLANGVIRVLTESGRATDGGLAGAPPHPEDETQKKIAIFN